MWLWGYFGNKVEEIIVEFSFKIWLKTMANALRLPGLFKISNADYCIQIGRHGYFPVQISISMSLYEFSIKSSCRISNSLM